MIKNVNLICKTIVSKNNMDLVTKVKGSLIASSPNLELGDGIEVTYTLVNDLGFNDAIVDFVKLTNTNVITIKIEI